MSGETSSANAFTQAKRLLVLAMGGIAAGLAIAGSFDRTTGGVVVLTGWIAAVAGLHRVGRMGRG